MIAFERYVERQKEWSEKTFGPGPRTEGVLKHIEKEIAEVRAAPSDMDEWLDIVMLALDGAWRAGHSTKDICDGLERLQMRNMYRRNWPPPAPPDQPNEHIREPSHATNGSGPPNQPETSGDKNA